MANQINSLEFYREGVAAGNMSEQLESHSISADSHQIAKLASIFGDFVLGEALRSHWRPHGAGDEGRFHTENLDYENGIGIGTSIDGGPHYKKLFIAPAMEPQLEYRLSDPNGLEVKAHSFDLKPGNLNKIHDTVTAMTKHELPKGRSGPPPRGIVEMAQTIEGHDNVERATIELWQPDTDGFSSSIAKFNIDGKVLTWKQSAGFGGLFVRISPAGGEEIIVPTTDRVPAEKGNGTVVVAHDLDRIRRATIDNLLYLALD